MIENIAIEKIFPHPDNPRKKLGDLGELEESIRTFGVLQNLTVVPHKEHKGAYTVVCGHRRLEAAKKAGLAELPCSIVDMDERTQLSTMLMENMQRSDLTPQEEAQGFQMILNLGGSVADIVKDTGLSETKIRHRVKLNELDQKILAKKLEGEISINDLISLERIKNISRRNEVLAKIGTNNFSWAVENAVIEERKEYVKERLKDLLPDVEIEAAWSPYPIVNRLEYKTCTDEEIKEFAEELKSKAKEAGVPALITTAYEWSGRIKQEIRRETSAATRISPEEKERQERIADLEDMKRRMIERGREFVRGISETGASREAMRIMPYAAEYLVIGYLGKEADDMVEALGREVTEVSDDDYMSDVDLEFHVACAEEPYRILLIATFEAIVPDGWRDDFWDSQGRFVGEMRAVRNMETLYKLLGSLGYEISDEEAEFVTGDSDLYFKE